MPKHHTDGQDARVNAGPANDAATAKDVLELDYRAHVATEADIARICESFSENGSPRSPDVLRWLYLRAPAGPALIESATMVGTHLHAHKKMNEPILAAMFAALPLAMRVRGTRVMGVQFLDALTVPAFRKRGLFVQLANALYARARGFGAQMVYGFPNENSSHGIFSRLGWSQLGAVPLMMRPLRLRYVLHKWRLLETVAHEEAASHPCAATPLPNGYAIHLDMGFDASCTALWKAFAADITFAVERDAQYLNWRVRRPNANYETLALHRHDKLVAFAIIGVRAGERGLRIGKIMELVFDPRDEQAAHVLALECMRRLRHRQCDVVWAWCFPHSPNYSALRLAGLLHLPKWAQRTQAHCGARSLTDNADIGNRRQWYMSLLDSDTE